MDISSVDPATVAGQHFDLIVVGSGFGSSFFLHEFLQRQPKKVLVIEWGDHHSLEWQVANKRNSAIRANETYARDGGKTWNFTVGLGGGTNCWYASTPRLHPTDFKLRSTYGVGNDWPLSYDDLEPFYAEAEAIMAISGDPTLTAIFPRSTPFPQPPHRMTSVDRMLKAAQPHQHFVMPTGRARVPTTTRPACCASFRCQICPTGAKFTANNGLLPLFSHPGVSVALKSRVTHFDHSAGSVQAVHFTSEGRDHRVTADLFVLGANAIHSPAILLRSGMDHPLTGKGLHESYGAHVEVYLDGLDNFDGSTIAAGANYGLYDGPFRSEYGGTLVSFSNVWSHGLRREPGRWRQSAPFVITTEDLLEDHNRVDVGSDGKPVVHYRGASEYAKLGLKKAVEKLPALLAALPVERIVFHGVRSTESHLQGTLRMGSDPASSVVDAHQLYHRWRNLVVVGTSVFPSSSCSAPSLTAAALSLRAARGLL
jgi:choline dehydrogenase-like flavoprotein